MFFFIYARSTPCTNFQVYRLSCARLQWIPSHCGIPENETADCLAKKDAADVPVM
uniref:RNase H type-1 domain-containing protein n=1 Tax=Arion vulgaris TaxID=1028688 RepID=A0A0B7B6J3_9EUPU